MVLPSLLVDLTHSWIVRKHATGFVSWLALIRRVAKVASVIALLWRGGLLSSLHCLGKWQGFV